MSKRAVACCPLDEWFWFDIRYSKYLYNSAATCKNGLTFSSESFVIHLYLAHPYLSILILSLLLFFRWFSALKKLLFLSVLEESCKLEKKELVQLTLTVVHSTLETAHSKLSRSEPARFSFAGLLSLQTENQEQAVRDHKWVSGNC